MTQSIIVSMIGPNNTIMLEMIQDNENERYHVRTYQSIDHAIARYEDLYETIHGQQNSAQMGTVHKLDPRIHVVDGDDVSVLVRNDVVVMDEFRIYGFKSDYGTMVGALAAGDKAMEWHEEGIKPGLVRI